MTLNRIKRIVIAAAMVSLSLPLSAAVDGTPVSSDAVDGHSDASTQYDGVMPPPGPYRSISLGGEAVPSATYRPLDVPSGYVPEAQSPGVVANRAAPATSPVTTAGERAGEGMSQAVQEEGVIPQCGGYRTPAREIARYNRGVAPDPRWMRYPPMWSGPRPSYVIPNQWGAVRRAMPARNYMMPPMPYGYRIPQRGYGNGY